MNKFVEFIQPFTDLMCTQCNFLYLVALCHPQKVLTWI